jgi:hypothetical protein
MFQQYTGLFLATASDEGQKQQKKDARGRPSWNSGAGKGSRTLDLNLGKVALYQLSYSRLGGVIMTGAIRTDK